MPCIALPTITPPTLPSPLSLGAPLPPAPPDLPTGICCKFPVAPTVPPLPTIPAAVLGPFVDALNTYVGQVTEFLDKLQLSCPRE